MTKSQVDTALGLLDWAFKYLPEYFNKPPSPLHVWLAEHLDTLQERRGTKINLIGPRGSAKSTLVTLAYVLQMAVLGLEDYIWIVSDTAPQACAHLENVALELTENDELATIYEIKPGRSWRQNRVVLPNDVTIEALSTGQRIRGRRRRASRPTLIVADDLQNDRDILSALQRQKARDWFHAALLPAGTPETNVVHLATALHREAIALELVRTPGWISRTFPSIVSWPKNLDLWQEWEKLYRDLENPNQLADAREFYERYRSALDAGAEVLWPEVEDLYTLMRLRAELGRTAFEREKQSSPISPELCEWPEEYFGDDIWFDEWPALFQVKVMTLDPSKGRGDRLGDYSAYVKLLVDRHGACYVQADLARRPTPQMVADGVAIYRDFMPTVFGVESTQYQELLIGEFAAEFRRQGLWGVQPLPVPNIENKQVRIRRIGPLLAMHRLHFKTHCPGTQKLVEQCKDFPLADHDDGPDALEMATRLAAELLNGRAPPDNIGRTFPLTIG